MGKAQTTKVAYPLACNAIRARRYRVEFLSMDKFVVIENNLPVHECNGAGLALRWVQERETERVVAANEKRLASVSRRE
jgi:hypothetical protein